MGEGIGSGFALLCFVCGFNAFLVLFFHSVMHFLPHYQVLIVTHIDPPEKDIAIILFKLMGYFFFSFDIILEGNRMI